MSVTSIAFTAYPVTDLPRAVAFYKDVLGLPQIGLASEHWVEFELVGATFGVGSFPQIGTPGSAQSLALEVSDLTAFAAKLKEHGVDCPLPAHETPVCFITGIKDPDGNGIIIHQSKHA